MRPIDADVFECVCTKLPDGVDSDSYLAGMLAGMDEILKRIDDAPTIQSVDRPRFLEADVISEVCEFLLMLDAAWVLLLLCLGKVAWPWIIVYWAILTIRNVSICWNRWIKR